MHSAALLLWKNICRLGGCRAVSLDIDYQRGHSRQHYKGERKSKWVSWS